MKPIYLILAIACISPIASNVYAGTKITVDQAIDSLYSKMSLPDSLDYSREFFVKNAKASLRARHEMPWGEKLSDSEFFNFVLPVRTNNELLDDSRWVFYEELAPRVKNMSMTDAALEVNHWAHEKATYRPSDGRTSSPLATVKTSWGRCGEESAFVVAAMRSVCIPARQVYTPRWAHTDDNHAWVEVYVDGKWQFLGGCEPEPELNMAWFNAPASRGMLMNTRTDGRYTGNEEVLVESPYYTLVNVTQNYAPVKKATVKAVDSKGKPIAGASVMFCLYNYGEFYPIATRISDNDGIAEVTTGLGDLVIWVIDGTNFGLKKMSVGKDNNFTITPDHSEGDEFAIDFDIIPPVQSGSLPKPTPEKVKGNDRRKIIEDSIRNAYMATFMSEEQARKFATENGYDANLLARLLPASFGNHAILTTFLKQSASDRKRAETLLSVISEKDLRDVTLDVLTDSYNHTAGDPQSPLYANAILNPRISIENMVPYKHFFDKTLSIKQKELFRSNPSALVTFVKDSVNVSTRRNPRNLRITPISVWRHRNDIDPSSRDIFFVAIARSLGIPAIVDPITGDVRYSSDGTTWTTVDFSSKTNEAPAVQHTLRLDFKPHGRINNPKYYSNFSISRLDALKPRQLEYDESSSWVSDFKDGTEIAEGYYMLVSGQRLSDGGVLARARFINANRDNITVPLEIRSDTTKIEVIGSFNSENRFIPFGETEPTSILSKTGRGYFVIGMISPNHEPSSHALNDISMVADEFDATGLKMVLLFASDEQAQRFNRAAHGKLPGNIIFGVDRDGETAADLKSNMKSDLDNPPVFVIADTFNRVVFESEGYTIHLGDKILDIIKRL